MYKTIILLTLILSSFLTISCGSDNNTDTKTTCDPACNTWETCVNGKCKITEKGACNDTMDCINSGDVCKDHKCITPASCNTWETYVESTNSCVLTPGRCLSVDDCTERQYCNSAKECKSYPAVSWSTNCPSYLSTNAECATVKLPLDYDSDNGKTIDVFIFRHKAISGTSKGQIWFLQGGPGGSGSTFSKYYFDKYTQKYPDYDFYSLDHRGVANSSRLSCSQEDRITDPVSFRECANELNTSMGDDLLEYSTTNAAKDVGFLMEMLKKPNKKRFVYGVSYGTYWAERYLTIFPSQADGVILDSICTLKHCYFDDYSKWTDVVGHQFMDVCKDDSTCKSKMDLISPDTEQTPQEAMKTVLDKMNTTSCFIDGYGAFDKATTQTFLTTMLMNFYARVLIPPVLVRLNRCNTNDKAVLKTLLDRLYGGMHGKNTDGFFVSDEEMNNNTVLYYNIVFGELWYGRTEEEITEVFENSLFNTGNGLDMYNMKNSGHWHEYGDKGYLNKLPETDTPVLMMNGTLDPQTALEIALPSKDFLNKEHQYFLTFPQTPHGITSSSYTNEMIHNYGQGTTCGEKIMFEWITNPTQEPDTSCYNDMYKISWNDDLIRGLGNMYMGTGDVWGDGSKKSYSKISPKFEKSIKESMEKTYLEYEKYPEIMKFIKNL